MNVVPKYLLPFLLILVSGAVLSQEPEQAVADQAPEDEQEPGSLVIDRIEREKVAVKNRSALLPHKRNYFLPLTWAARPNEAPFENATGESLDQSEAQFQLSLKSQLAEAVFLPQDALYVGFSVRAFWQAYNNDVSSPFRETNYEPEIFWLTPVPWEVFGGDASLLVIGLSHQSNGRSQDLSRSWNRVYANLIWERNRFVFSFKPWWRIPENEKSDPADPDGDDNPDIEDFLGHFEFTAAYRRKDQEVSVMLRNNLDEEDNRGAIQIDWTFPLNRQLRGYAQYFNGYGESLIDYDAHIERIGVGFLLSDLL